MAGKEIPGKPIAGETAVYASSKRTKGRNSGVRSPGGRWYMDMAGSKGPNQTHLPPTHLQKELAKSLSGKGEIRALYSPKPQRNRGRVPLSPPLYVHTPGKRNSNERSIET